eukprot:CAMPEP_0172939268 /NCGR_PEP_ID=MMETSP1075-20121228/223443_1 /TAXON_ID=2916 /ORGANISM="Ceratium fusus, Strain PA161109" /LENGTH=104 /DNA_ID=CAMNT_0013800655 /DNA_START=1847 /DNA_END=2162 /DNA_ORIENTATION=-
MSRMRCHLLQAQSRKRMIQDSIQATGAQTLQRVAAAVLHFVLILRRHVVVLGKQTSLLTVPFGPAGQPASDPGEGKALVSGYFVDLQPAIAMTGGSLRFLGSFG